MKSGQERWSEFKIVGYQSKTGSLRVGYCEKNMEMGDKCAVRKLDLLSAFARRTNQMWVETVRFLRVA